MRTRTIVPAITLLLGLAASPLSAAENTDALIADALKAAPPTLVDSATVMDWEGNVLREGSGSYTCLPTPPTLQGSAPMCMDGPWMAWGQAWQNKKPFETDRLGISYMLAGDEGASNIDPHAEGKTADNEWIVEGPHLMVLVPDTAMLEGIPTEPGQGGPYVMWAGTPYAHVMVPVGPRPDQQSAAAE